MDGGLRMLWLRSEFIAKIKKKISNAIVFHCVIYEKALRSSSKTLPIAMKKKLITIIQAVN